MAHNYSPEHRFPYRRPQTIEISTHSRTESTIQRVHMKTFLSVYKYTHSVGFYNLSLSRSWLLSPPSQSCRALRPALSLSSMAASQACLLLQKQLKGNPNPQFNPILFLKDSYRFLRCIGLSDWIDPIRVWWIWFSVFFLWQIFARTLLMASRRVWSMRTISLNGASQLLDRPIRYSMLHYFCSFLDWAL